jgi:hypothetical protein
MTPKLLLRIAAILIFIHAAGHTLGFITWKDVDDPVQKGVIQQMTGHQFQFMWATHSLGDYYQGFGYACSIALVLIAVLLWMISANLSTGGNLAKKITVLISYALLLWGIDEFIFFFPFATALTLVAAICSRWAAYLMTKQSPGII